VRENAKRAGEGGGGGRQVVVEMGNVVYRHVARGVTERAGEVRVERQQKCIEGGISSVSRTRKGSGNERTVRQVNVSAAARVEQKRCERECAWR